MSSFAHLVEASYRRTLTLDDFGGIAALEHELSELAGSPLLLDAIRAVEIYLEDPSEVLSDGFSNAVLDALCNTTSPAIYRDAADTIIDSPSLLTAFGTRLAARSLEQALQPAADATTVDALRAADALEVAAQLRLQDYAVRWDLFARLSTYRPSIDSGLDESYPRAVLRATVACIEQWTGAEDLTPVIRRIAGLEALGSDATSTPRLSDSDTGLALSRIALLKALRASDKEKALDNLNDGVQALAPALSEDPDRPDLLVAADIISLLQQLISRGRVEDTDLVSRIQENVRELIHLDPGHSHWIRDRAAASHQAWAQLSRQLADAHEHLRQPSWYYAAKIVDSIIGLYRSTRSARVFRRTDDGQALHAIIAPTLEHGFAAQASLLRHLEEHVNWLKSLVGEGAATSDQQEDFKVAQHLRDAALDRFLAQQEPPPKGDNGSSGPLDGLLPPEQVAAARVNLDIARRVSGVHFTLGSLVADNLLGRAREGFRGSPDYEGEVEEATDLVSGLLIRFLWDRNQLGESEAPYLYNESANEEDLAKDLHLFLRGSGGLGSVQTEIRRIAGGRVDVQFAFPGFNLYTELKVDATKTPTPDKQAYLRQAATYTVADQRIGFLMVLKLLPQRKVVAPHLSECLDVVEVADAEGGVRHIAAFTLSGGRTKPSDM